MRLSSRRRCLVTCESFEISDMVQKEVLKEITRRNSYVDGLKDKLNAIETENRRLKVDLNGDFTLLGALQTEVDALKKQTLSLAKDCLPPSMLKKELNPLSPQLSKIAMRLNEDQNTTKVVKDMELQKLRRTVKAIQKVVLVCQILGWSWSKRGSTSTAMSRTQGSRWRC